MEIGLQLYSVRREIEEEGLPAVVKTVKAAGLSCVEFAGFYGYTPSDMKKLLDGNGLKGISAHIGLNDIEGSLKYIDELGIRYVYLPWVSYEDLTVNIKDTVKNIKKAKALLDGRGIVFGYHNHNQEYRDGADRVADIMAEVDGLTSELDVFWATAAGLKPVEVMKKYGKKLSAVHLKDMDKRTGENPTEFPNTVIGEGKSDISGVLKLAKKMGVKLGIIEVEGFPCPYGEYLKKSAENIAALLK